MTPMLRSIVRQLMCRAAASEAMRVRWLLPVLLLAFVPGCYTYHAAEIESLEPGEEVRIEVGSGQISSPGYGSSFLGPRKLEARFTEATPDSLMVSFWIGSAYRGTPFETAYQDMSIPRDDVALVENRQLSRQRTAVAAVGTLAVIWFVIDGLGRMRILGGDDEPGDFAPPDGLPEAVISR
ncbi:MAG: hypothetical protein WD960_14055 [Gemmatimonadota bacterium]